MVFSEPFSGQAAELRFESSSLQLLSHILSPDSFLSLRDALSILSFPAGSDGKESACNAGDPGSIPGLGRTPGERND